MGFNNNPENYADFETVKKNVKILLTKKFKAKQGCKIGFCPLYTVLLTCIFFLPNNW